MRSSAVILAILLAGCQQGDRGAAAPGRTEVRAVTHKIPAQPDLRLADARIVSRAPWGSGAAHFGLRDEASRPGPMDLAVSEDGVIHVLDQVNRRVQRLDPSGRFMSPLSQVSETAEYISLSGSVVHTLSYDPNTTGHTLDRLSSHGPSRILALPAGEDPATGLFAAGGELWIERAHDRTFSLKGRVVMGRPHRGRPGHHVTASRDGLVIGVKPGDTTYRIMEVSPPEGSRIEAVEGLDTDAAGRVYLALSLTDEAASRGQDFPRVRRVAVVHRPGARPLTVELAAGQAADMNNYLAVGPGGGLFQLEATEEGVVIRRWQITGEEVRP